MPHSKKPWSQLPRVVAYEIIRLERSSEPRKDRFHFPVKDIPQRSLTVWALQPEGERGEINGRREARFEKAFKGVARSAHSAYGAEQEETPWATYVSAKGLTVLPLDDEEMAPDEIRKKEEADWGRVALELERWAASEFAAGTYFVGSAESESRHDENASMLKDLFSLREALTEKQELDSCASSAAAMKKAAPSI